MSKYHMLIPSSNVLSNARISGLLMNLSSSSIALSTLLISYAITLIFSLSFCNTFSLFSSSSLALLSCIFLLLSLVFLPSSASNTSRSLLYLLAALSLVALYVSNACL